MTKLELLAKCKVLHIRVSFLMIIDIYKDEDEIPYELIQILFKPYKSNSYNLIMGAVVYNAFHEAIKEYLK